MHSNTDYLPGLLQLIQGPDTMANVKALLSAAEANPGDPRPLLLLAGEYASAGDMDKAEGAYIATLQCAPDFAIARFQLGLLQFTSARPAAAITTWGPLAQLQEEHPLRLFTQGMECLAQDQFDQAIHWLEMGIARNTDNAPLNRDMQLLIQRIRDAASNTPPDGDSTSSETVAQFLISNYRNNH